MRSAAKSIDLRPDCNDSMDLPQDIVVRKAKPHGNQNTTRQFGVPNRESRQSIRPLARRAWQR
jgi:hypothetical protein